MKEIVIIGGGFGGVWSAASAASMRRDAGSSGKDLSITLITPGQDMVIRPRLYEAEPSGMGLSLSRILAPIGVQHVRASVSSIDVSEQRVSAQTSTGQRIEASYDRLVLATGSRLVRPDLAGTEHFHDVDTLPAAAALDAHLHRLPSLDPVEGRFTAVVVGSGFTGLEVSTELVGRLRAIAEPHGAVDEVRVVLIERADTIGPELGSEPRPIITHALDDLGVERRLASTIASLDDHSVQLSDGTHIAAMTAIWTAGMRADELTENVPAQRDHLGRLDVDDYLRVIGVRDVYAAGDTAAARVEGGHRVMQSCQHAHAMGKHAGHNAAAELLARPLIRFAPEPYVTCLDLGAAGAVFTAGFERRIRASGAEAKDLKRKINRAIYPPVDDADEIYRTANPRSGSRMPKPTGERSGVAH